MMISFSQKLYQCNCECPVAFHLLVQDLRRKDEGLEEVCVYLDTTHCMCTPGIVVRIKETYQALRGPIYGGGFLSLGMYKEAVELLEDLKGICAELELPISVETFRHSDQKTDPMVIYDRHPECGPESGKGKHLTWHGFRFTAAYDLIEFGLGGMGVETLVMSPSLWGKVKLAANLLTGRARTTGCITMHTAYLPVFAAWLEYNLGIMNALCNKPEGNLTVVTR